MVEDKGISHYDDACSRSSNEGDSLLSASSSPNMTSPSSTSALSAAGSSVDEGVDMTTGEDASSDICKRMLFLPPTTQGIAGHASHFGPHCDSDLPIDLSMKKNRTQVANLNADETSSKFNIKKCENAEYRCRRDSGDLVIDEDATPYVNKKTSTQAVAIRHKSIEVEEPSKLNTADSTQVVGAPASQIAPTYIPWSYVPRTASMPFVSSTLPSFWHPALLMSQAARQLAPVMGAMPPINFPTSTSTAGSNPFMPTASEAFKQMYDHNVLAEFSRICSQAKHLYGGHVLPGTPPSFSPNAHPATSSANQQMSSENARHKVASSPQENLYEKYARENGVTIKQEKVSSPNGSISRKRKHDDGAPSGTPYQPNNERQISPPLGKRIREEYNRGAFDHVTESDSPPSMVLSPFTSLPPVASPSEESRVAPKPVDFKPCRFPCNECGRTYATVGGLMKHSKTHHDPENANNFKCKTCEKEYNSLGALKMHIRTHTLPCKCHICGKAFSRTWLLQGHIRTHTGEKPYQCSVCSRAFADRSNLRAHMQTHESVKRYACTSCDKTFSRISLLNRHHVSGCVAAS